MDKQKLAIFGPCNASDKQIEDLSAIVGVATKASVVLEHLGHILVIGGRGGASFAEIIKQV